MKFYALSFSIIFLISIYLNLGDILSAETLNKELSMYLADSLQKETGSENLVTAIYLQTRVYDTLFETLLLLVSIVGVLHFAKNKEKKKW